MKQKRKVKSLLPYKIDRDGTMLTILLLILSLVLCLGSASLMTVSVGAADDRGNYPMVYPGIDDKVEVLYGLQISDKNRLWDEFVNQFFMKDKTLYLSPNQVKVKSNDSYFRDNTVDTGKYINVLGGEHNDVKSDNITIIAGYHNVVDGGNDNVSILGGEENKIKETSSGAPAVIAGGDSNIIEGNNSNVIIGGKNNIIKNAESAVILGGEKNTVNGGKNIIVGGSNVEVNGVDNVFVYSDSSTKFNPKSSNAFYLNLSDGVGINADAAKGGLSVSGAVGFGEIDITQPCNDDNIGVIGSWEGCLVGCTKASSSSSTWELLDRGSICEDKCEKNSKCMFTPTENSRTGADYTAFCTGAVSTEHADRCTTGENQSYENVVFETVIIDVNEECPVSGHNKCVYRCNPGTTLTGGECHQNCKLIWDDEVIVPHGYHTGAYNTTEAYCAKDTDRSDFPDTCGKHRHEIVCDDGEWLLANDNGKPKPGQQNAKHKGYINPSCQLGGYRCKTGTNYYNLKVSEITDKLQDDTNTPKNQNKSRVAKDRTTVNGRRGQYRICIDYDPAPKTYPRKTLNGDLCDTGTVTPQPPYHYKFIGCQTGDGYFPFTGQDGVVRCMQNCTLTGVNGIATGYRHNTSITGYMATGATCTGVCVSTKIVCNDGTWRLSKLTGEETTAFPYNDCVLSDKVCTGYDLNQSIYNQHHSNSVYDACVPYSGNGKFTCNKQVTGYKLTDCISGNHTELGDESWMQWCISNEKVVNCQTGDKDLLKYEYIITGVKINWSGSWNTGYWSEPKVCEWKCGKDFHLSGDYFSGGVCVSNTGSAPCKTGWAEGHVKYIEEDVVISWSGSWNTGSWTEPGNCRLTGCEAGWCGPNCLYTGADIQCKERTNLRSGEVNIIESSFVACGDEPEPCKLKCIEGYHTGENGGCDPDIKREPCEQIDPTKPYDTSFMLEYLWTDGQWKLSNASGTECPIGDGTAMFEWGSGFNNHLREMAGFDGNDVPVVEIIEKVDNIPSGVTTKIVSAPESELPIYAWYDGANGGTVYYYTHANVIYLNEDSSHMFEGMEMLNNIEGIGNWDSSKVINMSSMFKDTDLESLDLSKWDTSKVTNMSSMFENCSVTDLSLSYGFNNSNYWDTSKVTNMSSMFKGCSNLNNIGVHIMNWDTSKVTDMSSMFDGCKLTGNLNLENWNTSNVTNMSSMFKAYGGGLQYITIYSETYHTGRDTSKVTNMSSMFEGRSALKIIYGIDKLKTSNVTDMNSMFKDCYELSDLLIGNWNTSEVTDMSEMFSLDRKLSKLNLCSWNTSKVTDMTDMFLMCNNDYGGGCSTELQSIAVSESFKTNGVIESSGMFYGADSLSGGNGTKYNPSYTDKTYARIDKAGQPGYFTACEGSDGQSGCILDPIFGYSCVVGNDNFKINDGPGSSYIQVRNFVDAEEGDMPPYIVFGFNRMLSPEYGSSAYWALGSLNLGLNVSTVRSSAFPKFSYSLISVAFIRDDGVFPDDMCERYGGCDLYARQTEYNKDVSRIQSEDGYMFDVDFLVYKKVEDPGPHFTTDPAINCIKSCSKSGCVCHDLVYDARCEGTNTYSDVMLEKLKKACEEKSEDSCSGRCIWVGDSDPSSYTCKGILPQNASLNNPDLLPTDKTAEYSYSPGSTEPCSYKCDTGYQHSVETYTNIDKCVKMCTVTYDANGGAFNEHSQNHDFPGFGEHKWDVTYRCDATLNPRVGEWVPIPFLTGQCFDGWYSEKTGGTYVEEGFSIGYDRTLYAHWGTKSSGKTRESTFEIVPNGGSVTYVYTDGHEKVLTGSACLNGRCYDRIQDECGREIKLTNVSAPDGKTFKGFDTSCRVVGTSLSEQKIYSLSNPYRNCSVGLIFN